MTNGVQGPTDDARKALNFLTVAQTSELASNGVIILDPWSTLISPDIPIGTGTVVWPGTVLRCTDGGRIDIGESVEIGAEGGFTITAGAKDTIKIGHAVRLLGGGSLSDDNDIGAGAQILGPIRARNCHLAAGDSFRDPEPDQRGAVLKGAGVAHGIQLSRGQVIQAFGLFAEAEIRRQSYFHPNRAKETIGTA